MGHHFDDEFFLGGGGGGGKLNFGFSLEWVFKGVVECVILMND